MMCVSIPDSKRATIRRGRLFLVSAILLAGTSTAAVAQTKAPAAEVRKTLHQIASDANKRLPRMLDAEIRHDATVAVGLGLRYHYTLVNFDAAQVDPTVIHKKTKPKLQESLCKNPDSQVLIEYQIPVSYVYFGRDGKEITRIQIDTKKC